MTGLVAADEPRAREGFPEDRVVCKMGGVDDDVRVRRERRDRDVGLPGVEIDRLRADERERRAMLTERLERVEEDLPRQDVEGSGSPGTGIRLHPCDELLALCGRPAGARQQVGRDLWKRRVLDPCLRPCALEGHWIDGPR